LHPLYGVFPKYLTGLSIKKEESSMKSKGSSWGQRVLVSGLFLPVLLLATSSVYAVEKWQRTFGGSNTDYGQSVQQTKDGGYIIVGVTDSYGAGDSDVYLIKTNGKGNKVWEKTFGGSNYECGQSVQQTTDGGYIIVGYTYSYGAGEDDVYLIKTNGKGNKVWEKTFGGSNYECGLSVQQTTDGGYIIVGYTYSYGAGDPDVYLIKTNGKGNKVWEKTFGGSNTNWGQSVRQTTDGGYIIVGVNDSYGAGDSDVYLIKTNGKGNKVWEKTFGGSNDDYGNSVQQTKDGGYIIVGQTNSYGAGSYDVYLIKTNGKGNKVWEKTFGGSNYDDGNSVQQTTDGGYIIVGETKSYGAGSYDVYLTKTNGKGNRVWEKTFGGSNTDYGHSVQQTKDGGYIIVGETKSYGAGDSDVYLIKTNAYGKTQNSAISLFDDIEDPLLEDFEKDAGE
jgi:hypothetical protein